MPVLNRIAEFADEIAAWRQDFHAHPETLYDVVRTAGIVADKLSAFGCDEVVTGIGRTGVVGVINGRSNASGRVIALRADMDALPITEKTGKDYASTVDGKMHACGHDGHTAMLLGAAKYLAETRNFDGRIALVFQPAEEGGAGAKAMLDDRLIETFGIEEFYGLHNWPGMPAGHFGIRAGGIMAATDRFYIDITGQGGHAARPQTTIDPVIVAANMIVGMQAIVSRNVDPLHAAVLSVTMVEAGEADNVISQSAKITGTVRTLDLAVQDQIEQRLAEFVPQFAASFGATATVRYARGYPVTVNSVAQTAFAAEVASEIAGPERVDSDAPPSMGGEDFSFMLEQRPGAYIFLGNGDSSELHTDTYDFNDAIIPMGVSYFVRVAERALPVG
ncbi:M20 aminoacylase family protein [Devosia neptuniae]|jgi:amidohydrolase|uniref:M20 aminoacylase family protein n=2 Tax=Devosia TaxID=46913 RepID=UPI0022B00964|nr:M20 aminoacylase family protein [Devosia neptuniae]MCZ4344535.1 M20 family metallopeptidase [Devosia neptuniae]|tara:strand:- start:1341 stop:2510 length:1170 start_codon:yes stop_codon:yes gene_type:complete